MVDSTLDWLGFGKETLAFGLVEKDVWIWKVMLKDLAGAWNDDGKSQI